MTRSLPSCSLLLVPALSFTACSSSTEQTDPISDSQGGLAGVSGAVQSQGGATLASGGQPLGNGGGLGLGGGTIAGVGGAGQGGASILGQGGAGQGGATLVGQGGAGQGGATVLGQGGTGQGGATVSGAGGAGQGGATVTGAGGSAESTCVPGVDTGDTCVPSVDLTDCVRSTRTCTCQAASSTWNCTPTTGQGGTTGTGGATGVGGSGWGGAGSGGAGTGGSGLGGSGQGGAGTGGSGQGGASPSFECANLSAAAGASGQAKPSGEVGGLRVLDWAGFRSAVSYTFDDSNSSQIQNYDALNDAGGKYTFYLQTGKTSESSNSIWATALADGHELGNHTSDHQNCPSDAGINAAQDFIRNNFGVEAYAFAAPNGNEACRNYSDMFLTNRSVAGATGLSPGDTSRFDWIPSGIADVSDLGPSNGLWRIFCIHGFSGGTDGAYMPIALDGFTGAVRSAISGGAWVETITNVAAYQVGQSRLSQGSGNTRSWTLPPVFPPNMCVRVTTTGGTVKQNGVELPWNDHGYYEISLDALSLTIE